MRCTREKDISTYKMEENGNKDILLRTKINKLTKYLFLLSAFVSMIGRLSRVCKVLKIMI